MTLYEKLVELNNSDMYPLHMPGHKRNTSFSNMANIYGIDITEIDGFDDLHEPEGLIRDIEMKAEKLYGASRCFISVNGSTAANEVAILACTCDSSKILIARNSHKSVYYGLELSGGDPIFFCPEYIEGTDIFGPPTAKQIEEILADNIDCKTVVITSPTYEGVIADVSSIAKAVHKFGAKLIVDAAHGAHLGLSPSLPDSPVRQGADLVVMSLHKMLPAPTQTALLAVNSDDPTFLDRIRHYMSVVMTSSPSYILMAGIGEAIRYIEEKGNLEYEALADRISTLHESLHDLQNLDISFLNRSEYVIDPCKLVIRSKNCSVSGRYIYDELRNRYHIQCEMCGTDYALGLFSVMDTEEGFIRISQTLREIDSNISNCNTEVVFNPIEINIPRRKMQIAEAIRKPVKTCTLEKCEGEISHEYVIVYPPGMPMVVPGEVIDKDIIKKIYQCKDAKLFLKGMKAEQSALDVVCR